MEFKDQHFQNAPLLLCNVWDVISARAAQQCGFQVIGTSSGAIATQLGYEDGEQISFPELEYVVKRIVASVDLPLTVDLEAGYSRSPEQIAAHILRLKHLGVVGINLEDSLVGERQRTLVEAEQFGQLLSEVKSLLGKEAPFLNIRTDTFLLQTPDPVAETIRRARIYQAAGADGLFAPCIEKEQDIAQVVAEIQLPLNVMCMPQLPDFATLKELGVKRISMGNFVYNRLADQLAIDLQSILKAQSFSPLFN